MSRKLIIDGNAVYEIDEDCMLKRRLIEQERENTEKEGKKMQAVRTRRKKRISCDGNGMCGCVHPVLKCARTNVQGVRTHGRGG